ncbi:uncharacterized protein LOC144443689 [Glandiceps talaboti]
MSVVCVEFLSYFEAGGAVTSGIVSVFTVCNFCAELEKSQDEQDQYSRRENIEIHGIPEIQDERTDDITLAVLQPIYPGITINDIQVTHRIGKQQQDRRRHRPIIVRFVNRRIRDKVYKDRKRMKHTTTDKLGYETKNNIYINENLTSRKRNLMKKANDRRKTLNYKFLWTQNGNIYTRKDQSSMSVVIRNEADLPKIV